MAEITNELIREALKPIPDRLVKIEERRLSLDIRMNSMDGQMRGFGLGLNAANTDLADIYRALGTSDDRIARVEPRLDIADELVK